MKTSAHLEDVPISDEVREPCADGKGGLRRKPQRSGYCAERRVGTHPRSPSGQSLLLDTFLLVKLGTGQSAARGAR